MNAVVEPFVRDTGVVDHDNPWPGLASFRERDQEFFHGREAAIQILLDLVTRERVSVLYGASGLGKTSLIQAGLFPRARARDLFPVRLRLDFARPSTLIEQIHAALVREAHEHHVEAPERVPGTLWEFFYRKTSLWWNDRHRLLTPLLVFDQFEEMFTIGRRTPEATAAVRDFLWELRGLALGLPPDEVKARCDDDPDGALQYSLTRSPLRVLFSFREDYLAEFTELRELFPSIGEHDFRLLPMSTVDGLKVILSPGGHLVSEPVAKRIIEIIAAERPTRRRVASDLPVDPTLLSVFCRELNNERRRLHQDRITEELLKDIQATILDNFYGRSLAGLDPAVQIFIEDELVLPDSAERNSVAEEVALRRPGITRETLDELIDRRLLRRDERDGPARIELAHDVLIDPIRRSSELRHAREAEQQSSREAAQRFEELQRARRQKFLMMLSIAGAFALIFGVIAAVSAFIATTAAKRARQTLASVAAMASAKAEAEGRPQIALAYVAYAARTDQDNRSARRQLIDRLLHTTWPLPIAVLSHDRPVTWAEFDESGTRVLTLTDDGTVNTWSNAEPRDPVHRLAGPAAFARFAANRSALVVTPKGAIELWDPLSGRRVGAFGRPDDLITAAALSPDATLIAGGDGHGHLHLWRLSSPDQPPLTKTAQLESISIVQFSGNGQRLLTAGKGDAVVWELPSLTPVRLEPQQGEIRSADFSRDGAKLVTTYDNGTARLWAMTSAGEGQRQQRQGRVTAGVVPYATLSHNGAVTFAQFSPDGQFIVTASEDDTASVWDTIAGGRYGTVMTHRDDVMTAVFSRDGLRLLTASKDGSARLWDNAGSPIAEPMVHRLPLASASFSPDGERVVTASEDATAEVWDVRVGASAPETWNAGVELTSAEFGQGGQAVLVAGTDRIARVWDRGSGTSVLELGHEALSPPQFLRDGRAVLLARGSTASIVQVGTRQPAGAEMGGGGKILVARASHDGSRIATLSDTGVLALWDANGGPVGRYDVPIGTDQNRPIFLDFSRDARLLAVPGAVTDAAKSASGFVRVWDLSKTGSAPREFAVPVPLVFAAFSPDAKWLLAFGTTDTAYVFAVDDSEGAGPSLLQHDATIVSAAFTVNGTSPAIVTASTDQTAKMWKQPWRAWTPFVLKHNASVNATALSPDDDRVITASTDGYARVWDAETAELLAKFRHTSSVAAARFSPDGDHVVTVAADGRARVWDLPAGAPSDVKDLAALAEAVAGYRVDGNGQLVRIEDPVQELSAERQAAARLQNSSTLAAHVVRWFLADRWERTTSPFSGTTITRFIQDRLATEADDSRREVLRLYPGHPALREE